MKWQMNVTPQVMRVRTNKLDDNDTSATYNELVVDTSVIFSCISENSCCN